MMQVNTTDESGQSGLQAALIGYVSTEEIDMIHRPPTWTVFLASHNEQQ